MDFLKIFKAGFIWCGILLSLNCYGQTEGVDIPLGAMPLQLNPSFAGEAGAGRLSSSVTYSIYSTGSKNYFNSYSLFTSYDQFIPALRSGIGVTTGYRGSGTSYNTGDGYFTSLAIAPKISIQGKYTLSPSLDIRYGSYNSDYTDGTFPASIVKHESVSGRAGLLFNSNKFYAGYSVGLINNEKLFFYGIEQPKTKRFTSWLQLGYSFQRSSESKFSFTPQVAFSIHEKNYPDDSIIGFTGLNLNFRYNIYIAGINGTGFHAGIQNDKLKVMLTSNLSRVSRNLLTSNLSLRYIFNKADKGLDQSRF